MVKELTYPYCLKDGRLVSPEEVERGDRSLTCSGCTDRMLVRKGQIKAHHFAHYPDFKGTCNAETALHRAAKQAIYDGFNDAKASGRKYLLACICLGCSHLYNYDLTDHADRVVVEQSLEGSNIRPDITFLTGDGKPLITVEVVVSHPPSPETVEEYVRLEIPAFEVKPVWEIIQMFRAEHITEVHNQNNLRIISINQLICSHCRKQKEEHEKALEEQEKAIQRALNEKNQILLVRQRALEHQEATSQEKARQQAEEDARKAFEEKQRLLEDNRHELLNYQVILVSIQIGQI